MHGSFRGGESVAETVVAGGLLVVVMKTELKKEDSDWFCGRKKIGLSRSDLAAPAFVSKPWRWTR
ncbi:hypothetical protein IAQ61_007886 [Plenodomus lingam]|uniref:uncharacterized protein n=1 Tax=Leptosphaeria maculans TaxID=5022 RepID=UPI0033206192|nr:hypothetical protein IAQ61_007886 [Plenodomus lingam]